MYLKNKQQTINVLSIALVFTTAFGIVMHDMHVEKAATYIATAPAAYANSEDTHLERVISQNFHTHVERASAPRVSPAFRSTLPKTQPPRGDTRRYMQTKKLNFMGGSDAVSLWPSV